MRQQRAGVMIGLAVGLAIGAQGACAAAPPTTAQAAEPSPGTEAPGRAPSPDAPPPAAAKQIDWRDGDVEDAFAEARERNEPVLLYWGAKWCPPCNLMKQTLFKDPAFIAETAHFVAVHLDGDAKDAQLWGSRFGIAGYPTVIILTPQRVEVTRLSGSGMAGTLTDVLKLAASRTTSTDDLLHQAETPAALTAADWQLLASFDWFDDPKHVGDLAKGSALVARLAQAAPDPAMRRHFALTSLLMANNDADAAAKLTPAQQVLLLQTLSGIFASEAEVRANREELADGTASLILGLSDAAERRHFGRELVAAMDRIASDPGVPLGDRLSSVDAEIALAKADHHGVVPPAVLAKVRERVAMADKAATDPQMRQAVMPNAGQVLVDAGDADVGRRLWEGELPHAVAPFYYMADLSELAEADKDDQAALDWSRKAADAAQGPATRIQWAILYSKATMRLEPDNKAAVTQAADMVIDRLGQNSSGYAERTEKKVAAWSDQLRAWSAKHDGSVVLAGLSTRMDQACAPDRCRNVIRG